MATENTGNVAAQTSADPLTAALKQQGIDTTATSAPSMPTDIAAKLKPIVTEAPSTGFRMCDKLSPADLKLAQGMAQAVKPKSELDALNFGFDLQKGVADFTGQYLDKVKTKDSGVGQIFEDFYKEAGKIDAGPLATSGFMQVVESIPLIGPALAGTSRKFNSFVRQNESLNKRVVELVEMFDKAERDQLATVIAMEELTKLNDAQIQQLILGVSAGEIALDEMKAEYDRRAAALTQHDDLIERRRLGEYGESIMRFQSRLQSMRKAWLAAHTTDPMIRSVKKFALDQISGMRDFKTLGIMEFKKRLVIAVNLFAQKKNAKMMAMARELTDKMLAGNMELMREVQEEVAKNQREGITSAQVLSDAVDSLNDTLKARVEGIKTTLAHWDEENKKIAEAYDRLKKGQEEVDEEMRKMRFSGKSTN